MLYFATLSPDDKNGYDVTFVDFDGCVSHGTDFEDALSMAQEALSLHLETMLEDGDPLPNPSSIGEARQIDMDIAKNESLTYDQSTIYHAIGADIETKPKKDKPLRISISLKPAILESIDSMAEELGLTRSGLIAVATRDYAKRMTL